MRKYLKPQALSLLLLLIPLLYLATLARSLVLGDPTEYTFVANILGIAHPPGYAFITLLGKLFQSLVPFGEIPWRMHLLSATAATIAAFLVYGTIQTIVRARTGQNFNTIGPLLGTLAALFAALTVATGADFWQHAIHANPHIITATFLAANLFFLTRWWASLHAHSNDQEESGPHRARRWLYAFCFSAGLGVTHHPLTVFAFPAYAIFILIFARIILSWVNLGGYQIRDLVFRLTEPMLAPVRRIMPATQGLDLSPMIVLILASVLYRFLLNFLS